MSQVGIRCELGVDQVCVRGGSGVSRGDQV